MKETHLHGVQPDQLDGYWPHVEPFVERALVKTGAIKDYWPDDIKERCKANKMQCWIVHDMEHLVGAVITRIVSFPRRKVLYVQLASSEKWTMDIWAGYLETLKDFADYNGCEVTRIGGRPGWLKVYKPDNYLVEFDLAIGDA